MMMRSDLCIDTNDKGCYNSAAVNQVWCVFVKVETDMQASDSVGSLLPNSTIFVVVHWVFALISIPR